MLVSKAGHIGAPGWLSHDLVVRDFEPRVGLCADSLEPGVCFGFCVCFSLCPLPTHALSPPPLKNKFKKPLIITLIIRLIT